MGSAALLRGGGGAVASALTCPRRSTVSSGSLMKSSAMPKAKVDSEYAVGVARASMRRLWRRSSGKDVERRVGIVECRRVMGRRDGGMVRDGRMRRFGIRARGVEVIGVMIRLLNVRLLILKRVKAGSLPCPHHV